MKTVNGISKVLKKDIIIPAGTVFQQAPTHTDRIGEGHISHVIGLTKDSSGELTYCLDPGDPAIEDWFGDEPETFKAVKNNIIRINNEPTTLDIPPERVLEAAKGQLKTVLVLGVDKDDGEEFYFCSSTSDKKECLWLVDNFKHQLMNDFKDLVNVIEED